MKDHSNPELRAILDEWDEEIAQTKRAQEHQWLIKAVKDLQLENARIRREIERRDRFILWHALDGKLRLSDFYPLVLAAYVAWYFRESWWQSLLSLAALQICYAMYAGTVIGPRLQAKRDAIFKAMEG